MPAHEVILGPYRITALLGEGGMGRVYRAVHLPLDREVALKLLHGDALDSPEARSRFHREMRLAATLNHPNVVKIFDGGVVESFDFLAMELVPGQTVNTAVLGLERAPWPWVIALGACLADALAHLHAHGIIHRDVKHNNVKLTPDGQVKLLDFGLARALDSTALTGDGVRVGTFRYIAPEVLTSEPATGASDLWSVGVMMYELLTGRPFLEGTSLTTFVADLINEDLVPVVDRVPELPRAVSDAVMRLLEKDVSRRTPSATQAAAALTELLAALDGRTPEQALHHGFGPRPPGSGAVVSPSLSDLSPPPRPSLPSDPTLPLRPPSRAPSYPPSHPPSHPPMPPPTRPDQPRGPTRHGLTIAALTSGALVAMLLVVLFPRGAPKSLVKLDFTPPSRSAPPSAWQAPAFVPHTDRWREVAALVPRLRAGGLFARQAITDCRTRCGIDLGPEPDLWLGWVELGRWLESSSSTPPRLRAGARAPGEATEESLMLIFVSLHDSDHMDELTEAALKLTLVWSANARGWLLLGLALEHDKRLHAARRAYRVGLERLRDGDIESAPGLLLQAIGRAVLLGSPRGPTAEWLYWMRRSTNQNKAWRGLRSAIERTDPGVYEATLRRATEDPLLAEAAYYYLGKHLLDFRRDPARSIAALSEGAKRMPTSSDPLDMVVSFHLERGDLASAATWLAAPFARDRWREALARMRDDGAPTGPCDPAVPVSEWRQLNRLALGYLERGCLPAAEQVMNRPAARDEDHREDRTPLMLELLAMGSRDAWVEKDCRAALFAKHVEWDPWAVAAGALARPAARPRMEVWLNEAEARFPGSCKPSMARALWLSRCGRHADALAVMARARPMIHDDHVPKSVIFEVLSRPIWAAARGDESARLLLAAVLAERPPEPCHEWLKAYWSRLVEGNLAAAADLAIAEFAVDPQEPLWTIAIATFASLPGTPESYKPWKKRLKFAARASTVNPWLTRELKDLR